MPASKLQPQQFQQFQWQLQLELGSGSAREVQDDGQVVLEAVVRESCTAWRLSTSRATAALEASRWNTLCCRLPPAVHLDHDTSASRKP
ncbi:MAG: hypothetical protein ACK5QQ_06610 [Cyanobacteriota bacterium]